jgi:hypothetical protein
VTPQQERATIGTAGPVGGGRGPERGPLARVLVPALTERLAYKAAALFFAVALWLVVASAETAERLVPVLIAPHLDSGVALIGPTPTVRALVVGRARDLLKLGDAPLVVRRVVRAEPRAPDTVTIELRPGDVDLPARTSAVVRDVQPHSVTLHLAPAAAAARRPAE